MKLFKIRRNKTHERINYEFHTIKECNHIPHHIKAHSKRLCTHKRRKNQTDILT